MIKPAMLCVSSPMEMELSNTQKAMIWKSFITNGSSHSRNASTLPFIIRRCEQKKIPYTLHAHPDEGYYIKPMEEKK